MLMIQSHNRHFLTFNSPISLSNCKNGSLSPHSLVSIRRPITFSSLSALPNNGSTSWIDQVFEPIAAEDEDGPVELPPQSNSIFATTDDPSSLQVATSVLLTGAITVFLFRSIRRRAKRAKELKFRSSDTKKTFKEEALDNLKSMGAAPIQASTPPSPVQAFLGAISAGVIALILYKFTTTTEASLNRQTISDNLSVRQITITVRTIINGICYLATFVFGINGIGLFLYACQLVLNSLTEDDKSDKSDNKGEEQISSSATDSPPDSTGSDNRNQNTDEKQ